MNKYNKIDEDLSVKIFQLYSQNKLINVIYFENGLTNIITGMIGKIDYVEKQIIMIPLKKILFLDIIEVNEIS